MLHTIVICLFLNIPSYAYAAVIAGGGTVYPVSDGDKLLLISAKLDVDNGIIAREDNLKPTKLLQPGQELRLHTRKMAPHTMDNGIIIDIPGRMLYYFKEGKLKCSFLSGSACRNGRA